jgi:hypothetical protein
LSFFLWSSIPDDALLDAAAKGRLRTSRAGTGSEADVADPKSESLTSNFAAQWLYLRNLKNMQPLEEFRLRQPAAGPRARNIAVFREYCA